MKTKPFNRYSFAELHAAATASGAEQIDIDTLAAWCGEYGNCWNGECFDASLPSEPSGTLQLFPVYSEGDEDDVDIDHYEMR